ncbi:ABC transporter ATP-binding protein, partial [bacterium]|nr:ABC transporter ATP-binding protein [bacterium]
SELKNECAPAADGGAMLPDRVRRLLDGSGEPELWALADIGSTGQYGEAWVVLRDRELTVADLNDPARPHVRSVPLDQDSEIEVVQGTGTSRFRVLRGGRLEEELQFSCRQAKRFSALLHRSQARCRGGNGAGSQAPAAVPVDERLCPKCSRLIPEWTDGCPRCLHRRRILLRLLGFAQPYRGLLITGLLSALVAAGLQLVPPKLTKHLINQVLTAGPAQRPELLWPLIGALAVVIGVRVFWQYLRLNRLAKLSEYITHDLRSQTFAHLQKLSLAYYSKKPTGNLISRITHDTDRLWDFITFGIVDVAVSLCLVVGIAVILFLEEPVLATLTMAPIPIGLALMYVHVGRVRTILTRLWTKWSSMTSVLSDVIPGTRVVKAFTQEDREAQRFAGRSQAVVDDSLHLHKEWTVFWPRLTLLLNLGTVAIWAYAAPRVLGHTFDLGTFVMFLGYVWMFYGPIEHLGMMNRMFQRATTSAHRIFAVLDTPPVIYSKPNAIRRPDLRGEIVFENVGFTYDGVKRVLQEVSFRINPGEVVGLAGPSGGGKTTMINLICRFYDPVEGRILMDGVDLREWDLHDLRSRIGVVLQEPYLFRGTIAQNIAYGSPAAAMDEIIAAARAANAHEFIVGFPDAYDTLVGERGQTVSGGERQRLSIARAILNDPRILIFDEATSSVDSKTELNIQQAIDRLVAGRTTIAIAHRLSTLRRAHRLLILDKGRLAEQGTHAELLAAGGLYAGLHRTQSELHALFAV